VAGDIHDEQLNKRPEMNEGRRTPHESLAKPTNQPSKQAANVRSGGGKANKWMHMESNEVGWARGPPSFSVLKSPVSFLV
jgi:hypothetical protein